jgi:hypothetical protein
MVRNKKAQQIIFVLFSLRFFSRKNSECCNSFGKLKMIECKLNHHGCWALVHIQTTLVTCVLEHTWTPCTINLDMQCTLILYIF